MTKDLTPQDRLTWRIDARLDGRVGSNSNVGHFKKSELVSEIKGIIQTNVINQINLFDLWPKIERIKEYQNLPLIVICDRYYTGRSQEMDEDNLASCFKPWVDGLCLAIGFTNTKNTRKGPILIPRDDPKSLKMRHFQIAKATTNSLNFTIMPYYHYAATIAAQENMEKDEQEYDKAVTKYCAENPDLKLDKAKLNEEFYKVKLSLLSRQVMDACGNLYNRLNRRDNTNEEQVRLNLILNNYNSLLKEAVKETEPEIVQLELDTANV